MPPPEARLTLEVRPRAGRDEIVGWRGAHLRVRVSSAAGGRRRQRGRSRAPGRAARVRSLPDRDRAGPCGPDQGRADRRVSRPARPQAGSQCLTARPRPASRHAPPSGRAAAHVRPGQLAAGPAGAAGPAPSARGGGLPGVPDVARGRGRDPHPGGARRAGHRRGGGVRGGPRRDSRAPPAMPTRSSAISKPAIEGLAATRPTAVNLFWALDRMRRYAESRRALPPEELRAGLVSEAELILEEDVAANRRLGAHGAELVPAGARILTHCNAGGLATAGYGTALGVVRAAVEAGRRPFVWVDETRPVLQGARLTAWELVREGIPHAVIADVAAASTMARGEVDLVVVGADRIARNGDTANKIGTYGVAVLAAPSRDPLLRRRAVLDHRCRDRRRLRHPHRGARSPRGAGAGWAADRAGGVAGSESGLRRHPGRAHHRDHHRARHLPASVPLRGIARAASPHSRSRP